MSYRAWIVAVAFGLTVVFSGEAESQDADQNQSSPHAQTRDVGRRAEFAIPIKDIGADQDHGCPDGKDNPSSDLCAQWKAANAAYEGAKWGWWQLIIGGFGIALGAITMAAAIAAAVYARRAAIATETTVHVTRDVSLNQSRAYIQVDKAELTWGDLDGANPRVTLTAINSGQTPAKWFEVTCACVSKAEESGLAKFNRTELDRRKQSKWNGFAASGTQTLPGIYSEEDFESLKSVYKKEKSSLTIFGTIRYCTFFGEVCESDFFFQRGRLPGYEKISEENIGTEPYQGGPVAVNIVRVKEHAHLIPKAPCEGLRTYQKVGNEQ